MYHIVGVFNGEGPPVPIPNTAVKLTSADDTRLETDWENRSAPALMKWVPEYWGLLFRLFGPVEHKSKIPDG